MVVAYADCILARPDGRFDAAAKLVQFFGRQTALLPPPLKAPIKARTGASTHRPPTGQTTFSAIRDIANRLFKPGVRIA